MSSQLTLPLITADAEGIDKALTLVSDVPDIMFAFVYRKNTDLLRSYVRNKSNKEDHIRLSSKILNGVISEFEEKKILQENFLIKQEGGMLFFLSSIVNSYELELDENWYFKKDKKGPFDEDEQSYDVIGYLLMGIKI